MHERYHLGLQSSSLPGRNVRLFAGCYLKCMREENNQHRESSLTLWEVYIVEDKLRSLVKTLAKVC